MGARLAGDARTVWSHLRGGPERAGALSRSGHRASLLLISLLMVLYPFEHDTGRSNLSPGDAIVVLVAVWQVYGALHRPLPLPRYTLPATGLVLVALASATVNVVQQEPYFSGTRATLIETLKLVMATLWMCVTYWLLSPRFGRGFLQLAFTSVVFAFGTALGAIALTLTSATDARPDGTFDNANLFGAYLSLNAFLALAAHGVLRQYADREGQAAPAVFRALTPVLLPVVLPVLLLGILATGSRGALIGTVGGALLSGCVRVQAPSARRTLVALTTTAVLVAGLRWYVHQGPLVLERLVHTAEGDGKGVGERVMLWQTAQEAFATHPVLGVGYGQFRNYAHLAVGENKLAHQTYLSMAAELGFLGVVVFAWLVVSVLRDSGRHGRIGYGGVFRASRGYIIAVLVQGLFANVQHSRAMWICFGIVAVQAAPALGWVVRPMRDPGSGPGVWRIS